MSYIVLARKWRPQSFEELVGQDAIAKTLQNAISSGRIAHAYLFAGPRGTGKTSTARILAKALNCVKGLTPSPCNKCDNCVEISSGRSMDVLEIDGASNRGIDEVRELRENVKFAPISCRYKVYIIDEVHMLTKEAFNALLKTLEEPPPHVVFIFATTEPHSVPPTILSRCQRFDFRRIPARAIMGKLREIADAEGIEVEEDALFLISRVAEGSMRDAQVILDQLISFVDGRISEADVSKFLGLVERGTISELTEKVLAGDLLSSFSILDSIISKGHDMHQLIKGWRDHMRNLLLAKIGGDAISAIDLPDLMREEVLRQSEKASLPFLLASIELLNKAEEEMKRLGSNRVFLEAALVKMASMEPISIRELLEKIGALERSFSSPKPEATGIPYRKPKRQEELVAEPKDELERVKMAWADVIKSVEAEKRTVAAFAKDGAVVEVDGDVITIEFKHRFHKEHLEMEGNRNLLEGHIRKVLGKDYRVRCRLRGAEPEGEGRPGLQEDPLIRSAVRIFDGIITEKRGEEGER
jgi:DNA polymerase-3 subunit gamma/tau